MARKPKGSMQEPPSHTDEAKSGDRNQASPDRPPPEPFEECGPSGGYGGAGTDETEKDD
jgi:hypothetical protein